MKIVGSGVVAPAVNWFLEIVVKGLNDHCERVSFIIVEVSVRKSSVESYRFYELVNALWDRGFSFYTVVSPPNSKPFHHDMLFLPISNPMLQ
jgi:hypothetical protein